MPFKWGIARLQSIWWWLRQMSGDAAYENYLQSIQRKHPPASQKKCYGEGQPGEILSREAFFEEGLRRRYNSVSRCC